MTTFPLHVVPAKRPTGTQQKSAESATSRKSDKRSSRGAPKLKLQIDFPGGARLGPGKVDLLEHIDQEGSLSKASAKMGISYRRAWLFMQQINRAFDEPAVATPEHGHGGGPARLTPFGREIVRHYRELEAQAVRAGAEIMVWLDRHKTGDSGPGQGTAGTSS